MQKPMKKNPTIFKPHSLKSAVLSLLTVPALLSGCFQNLSGTDGAGIFYKGSSNSSSFSDTGGSSLDGSFNGNDMNLSTLTGGFVGSFASPTNPSQLGLMINLKIPISNSIGDSTLNDLLARVDSDPAVQNINVSLSIPQFSVKATFKFSTIAANNNKALRNVMVIRPGLTGVDLSTGYAPDEAPLVQLTNNYIYSYGGKVNDTPVARLSVFFRDALTLTTSGFLPSPANTSWGVGFPDNSDPQTNAVFMPLTENLGRIFGKLWETQIAGTNWEAVASNASSYLLAIHTDSTKPVNDKLYIKKAYIILPSAGGNNAPPSSTLLCSSANNDTDQQVALPSDTSKIYKTGVALACNCEPMFNPGGIQLRDAGNEIFEPCGDGTAAPASPVITKGVQDKLFFLQQAIAARPATPSSGIFPATSSVSNGVTLSTY